MDFAISSDPAVQRQLARLTSLAPGLDVLGLDRIGRLLDRLGNPQRDLPPVFHVAGTNGKGSTCAFLRAAIEASGHTVHVFTSPHLVRFNERIRVADRLIEDDRLAELLAEVLDAGEGIGPSFFEATTAAAFLAFARTPAAACVIEVGLGGRLDATNVIEQPVVCGIAQLGLDHQQYLGERLEDIAAEKAGIAKANTPLVTLHYPPAVADRIGAAAAAARAPWLAQDVAWTATADRHRLRYIDGARDLELPLPRLPGAHQAVNAGLAIAMLRHQHALEVPEGALGAAMGRASWPARLQRITSGPLRSALPSGAELWLDGGHNPAAGRAIADHFRGVSAAREPFHIILGMLKAKDAAGYLRPFARRRAIVHAVPIAGHEHHAPAALASAARGVGLQAEAATGVAEAIERIAHARSSEGRTTVLIAGSLHLAGQVLAQSGLNPE